MWIRRTAGGSASDFVQVKGLPRGATMSRPQFVTQPAGAVVVAVNGELKRVDAQNRVHADADAERHIEHIRVLHRAGRPPDRVRLRWPALLFRHHGGRHAEHDPGPADRDRPEPRDRDHGGVELGLQLVVGGRAQNGNIGKIAEMNVDGSLDPNPFTREYGSAAISQVAAYSYDPLAQLGFDEVMVQARRRRERPSSPAGHRSARAAGKTVT